MLTDVCKITTNEDGGAAARESSVIQARREEKGRDGEVISFTQITEISKRERGRYRHGTQRARLRKT